MLLDMYAEMRRHSPHYICIDDPTRRDAQLAAISDVRTDWQPYGSSGLTAEIIESEQAQLAPFVEFYETIDG